MTGPAGRGRDDEYRYRARRSRSTSRRAVWATSILLVLALVSAIAVVRAPGSPRGGAKGPGASRSQTTAAGGNLRTGGPGVTIGSAAGQPLTGRAERAASAASSSSAVEPVPGSFDANLVGLYVSMYDAARALPGMSQFATAENPVRFSASVDHLTARERSELYGAFRSGSSSSRLRGDITSFIPVERAAAHEMQLRPSSRSKAHRQAGKRAVKLRSRSASTQTAGQLAPQDLTVIPSVMPQTGSFGGGVNGVAYVANCPSYWSTSVDPYADNAIYALQLVIDVSTAAYNAASHFNDAFPVSVIAAVLLLVAQEVQNDGIYLKSEFQACEANNVQNAGLDIDNSTYQTYQLLASVAGTVKEADTNLAALINQNAADYEFQLQGIIERALTAKTTPMASLELPSADGGYLDSTPIGVQSVVTTEIANLASSGQLSNPMAERDLGLGGQAYAAGEYKLAFTYYQLAYQAASQ